MNDKMWFEDDLEQEEQCESCPQENEYISDVEFETYVNVDLTPAQSGVCA